MLFGSASFSELPFSTLDNGFIPVHCVDTINLIADSSNTGFVSVVTQIDNLDGVADVCSVGAVFVRGTEEELGAVEDTSSVQSAFVTLAQDELTINTEIQKYLGWYGVRDAQTPNWVPVDDRQP